MNLEELQECSIGIFKTNKEYVTSQKNKIESLSKLYQIDDLYESMINYREVKKRGIFTDYVKEINKWIQGVKKIEIYSRYQNKDIEYIIENLLDSMEYNFQKNGLKNKNEVTRFNRINYIFIGKEYAEKQNSQYKSLVINERSEIEIVSQDQTLFINQIQEIIDKWFDLVASPELKQKIKNITIREYLKIFLINYFWDNRTWTRSILEPLTYNFENDIIIKTGNDMAISINEINKVMIKLNLKK